MHRVLPVLRVITLFSFLSIATPVAPVLTVSASSAPESRGELFFLRFTFCRRLCFFLWFERLLRLRFRRRRLFLFLLDFLRFRRRRWLHGRRKFVHPRRGVLVRILLRGVYFLRRERLLFRTFSGEEAFDSRRRRRERRRIHTLQRWKLGRRRKLR